jgi:hypothetical protein
VSEWIATYTSMPIEAGSAEEAIEREGSGGGHWNAYPLHHRPGALKAHAAVWPGDADLPVILGAVGGLRLAMYQHRDTDDGPLPVVVLDLDRDDLELAVRVYVGDTPVATLPAPNR